MIYTIRTTSGREDIVVDLLMTKLKESQLDIKTVFHPAEIKGYVFVEGKLGAVQKAMVGLMHARGLIDHPVQLQEIEHFLQFKKDRIKVDMGDIVEIIGGPFKGEKGKVTRIDKVKDEVTIELLEASIPIPVTIATEFVKVITPAKVSQPSSTIDREEKESKRSAFDAFGEPEPEREQGKEKSGAAEGADVPAADGDAEADASVAGKEAEKPGDAGKPSAETGAPDPATADEEVEEEDAEDEDDESEYGEKDEKI